MMTGDLCRGSDGGGGSSKNSDAVLAVADDRERWRSSNVSGLRNL